MAGTHIEQGIPGQERPKPPERQQVVMTGDEIEIINFGRRGKVIFRMTEDGPEIVHYENLTTPEERLIKAKRRLMKSTRNLLTAVLAKNATLTAWETDTIDQAIGPELNVVSLQGKFDISLASVHRYNVGEKEVNGIVNDQVRQLTMGETKMGFVPSVVREAASGLYQRIRNEYEPRIQQ